MRVTCSGSRASPETLNVAYVLRVSDLVMDVPEVFPVLIGDLPISMDDNAIPARKSAAFLDGVDCAAQFPFFYA